MAKEIRCYGCGAIIQSDNIHKIGYVPKTSEKHANKWVKNSNIYYDKQKWKYYNTLL